MSDGCVDFSHPMPLFPLDQTVLLPHGTTALHLFEPRDRAMIADVLPGRRLVALARLEPGAGHAAVRPCVCVGYIVRHQPLSQGRCNILLQGISRGRLVHECDVTTGYRQAILKPLETSQIAEKTLSPTRERLEQLLNDPLLKQLAELGAIHDWLTDVLPTATLVDLIALASCDREADRYWMLAQADVRERAAWLDQHLCSLRSTLALAQRLGVAQSDDGLNLN